MIKFLGIAILFFVSCFLGFYKANLLTLRQKKLLEICFFIEIAISKIRLQEEMSQIIKDYGKKAGFFQKDLAFLINEEYLNANDISLVNTFLEGLGMGDSVAEIKRCETYMELFKQEHKKAEAKTKERAALYKKLGVFLGILVSIVLI